MFKRLTLSALMVCAAFSSAHASSMLKNDCGYELLYAKNTASQQEVRLCLFSKEGQNYMKYHISDHKDEGKVLAPAIDVVLPTDKIHLTVNDGHAPALRFDKLDGKDGNNMFVVMVAKEDDRVGVITATARNSLGAGNEKDTLRIQLQAIEGKYTPCDFGVVCMVKGKAVSETTTLAPALN